MLIVGLGPWQGCASTPVDTASQAKEPAPGQVPIEPPPGEEPVDRAGPDSAASPAAEYLDDDAALQRAHRLFRAVCTGYCHSTQAAAERVAPDLFDCSWENGSSDGEVFQVIANGVPDTQMQGFAGKLSDEDLWKLVAYLRQRSRCG